MNDFAYAAVVWAFDDEPRPASMAIAGGAVHDHPREVLGVRGTIAVSTIEHVKYGGNTSCIEVVGATGPVIIHGNSDSLEQAARNLIENALRFSQHGSTVTVNVDDGASISVIDRGIGVPPAKRDEIFQRFVRSDRKAGGTGLGLSIVQRTVDAHGGIIEVEDTRVGGATFILRFPPLDVSKA